MADRGPDHDHLDLGARVVPTPRFTGRGRVVLVELVAAVVPRVLEGRRPARSETVPARMGGGSGAVDHAPRRRDLGDPRPRGLEPEGARTPAARRVVDVVRVRPLEHVGVHVGRDGFDGIPGRVVDHLGLDRRSFTGRKAEKAEQKRENQRKDAHCAPRGLGKDTQAAKL